ncbi:acyltransferase family protein [Microcella frigidaquae]|uniref:Peptidoglycan/LPS O-acetylase OafA/YrhL n=1 Tax=Microcella frigidaquae TaxID=424758 RepID=A0A840XPA9_9MICO|nr:acyltransferase family protein [Microcella frigidaquae]MBB5617759.1 peptidoglycan/LPS O-acetylase OafA/YrhL [Microcella frigidaquae]NHN45526.1 acetyltransferase [Microcella frigidaquae]
MSIENASPGRLPGLDGLRALAITLVLGYHLFPGLAPGGFVGVDVFLVVSGYLITALLVHEHRTRGTIRLGSFWARRARRLLPALVLVIAAVSLVAASMGGDVLVGIGWQLLGVFTFSYNWWSIAQGASYLDQTSPELFRHAWSLAVEEQFYLLWPLALLALLLIPLRAVRVAVPLVLALASAGGLALLAGDPALDPGTASIAYLSTLMHGFGLLLGAGLALALDPLRPAERTDARPSPARLAPVALGVLADVGALLAASGLVALALVLSIDQAAAYRGGLAAAALLTGVLIVCLRSPHGRAAGIADAGLPRWVGERSYGLYLWHWPVIVLLGAALPAIDRGGLESWWLGLAALALSVVLAAGSYRLVEQPVRRHGWAVVLGRGGAGVATRRAGAVAASVIAIAMAAGVGLAVTRAPDQSEAAALIAAGQAALDAPPPAVPLRLPMEERGPQDPGTTPLPGGNRITAVGDSVMLASAPQLQARFPGIAIDAAVSRQLWQGLGIIEKLAASGRLREFVVLGLGTNGSIDPQTLRDIRRVIGPDRWLVLVNPQAPRGWIPAVSRHYRAFADDYRNVVIADWRGAIAPRLDILAPDQVHPGPTGARIYTGTIADALQYLVDLPEPVDYGAYPDLHRPR